MDLINKEEAKKRDLPHLKRVFLSLEIRLRYLRSKIKIMKIKTNL